MLDYRTLVIRPIDQGLAISRVRCVYLESFDREWFGFEAGLRCNCYKGIHIWRLEP